MKKRLTAFFACLFLIVGTAFAQNKITGTVISNDDGEPIIGASVIISGTKNTGTSTDIDGKFTIIVPQGKKIKVSYIGMKETTVTPKNGMTITLYSDATMVDEVVVTGMVKQDKRLFTGSASKIDADKAKLSGLPDVSRSLEGRAAGVSVQNVSGTFGTAPKIRIRGATSIYGNSKPLWVVDGVIMEDVTDVSADDLSSGDANTLISSAIAGLNSDDIETFDILKDGSATSIYGARAMAGVIVITTKKGRSGQARINYTGEYTMRLKPSYSTFNIMNSQDQMSIYQEMLQKGYLNYAETSNAASSGIYGKMYQLFSEYDRTSGQFGLANTAEARANYLRQAEFRNTDWFDILFSNSIQHNHSVSISTGTDKSQTYASVSAMFDPGWTKQSKVERYTANLNNTFNISKKLTFNMIANSSYRKQRAPGTLSSEVDVVSGEVHRSFDINPYSYALNTSRALDENTFYTRNYAPFNILHELDNNYIDLSVFDMRVQGELKYKPVRQLEFSVLGAYKFNQSTMNHQIMDEANQAQAYRSMATTTIRNANPFLYTDPDDIFALPVSVLPYGGIYNKSTNNMNAWDFRTTASYNNAFANDTHIVNLYGGIEVNNIDRSSDWFRGWGMQYSLGEIANYAYQVFKKGAEDNSDYFTLNNTHERRAAFFGTATYSYKGRYTLNGTVRYEGTNKLGKSRDARWLPTWNVSAAWNAHEEPWFNKVFKDVLSHATFKASYSLTAESGPSWVTNSLPVISSYNPWRPSAGLRESGLQESDRANGDLTFEKKHELNLGLQLGFLNNRINFEFDWYKRNNYDLIGIVNTQMGGMKYGNVASMKSNGVELSINTTNIKTKDFTWSTNIIYSHTHNEVTELENNQRVIDLVSGSGFALEGYPVRSLFSIPFMGLNNEGLPTFLDQDGNITTTGIYFQTQDKEKLGFLEYSGSVDPTDVGSFGNNFRYKGITLNVFVTYSFGNVVRLDPVFKNRYNDLNSMPREYANRWMVPGDEATTTIPVIASSRQNRNDISLSYAYNAYNYSTERIAKGDFIRMKEVSLGYDFPQNLVSKLSLNSLSLKLQATNLFLIYADKKLNGQDPEFFNTGGVAVPLPKQFTLTLRFGL
ncbi:SusC/RagA family TonB-linked outer membrane protein [Prevotella sp. E9-3]|uniref:SusC/RagA family TonB-linked outer membrane protein n=1 Tax=Prevotella sp. E9-3 TaxID=2913621 RepID=UPI001EDBC270|nr:SusC/RagA family TonB-linked outer membrane protein [Prevotella sp. E9-3]UKK47731.1 SusC/RagA family TonB-linked outer membrane protein [Prevotella sp. E9-3]